jgi:cell division protein FtsI/penicillin-binding protein 2
MLAVNKTSFSAFIMPNAIVDYNKVATLLHSYFPQAHELLETHKDKPFMFIKRRLSPELIALLKENELPDIHLLQEESRGYPHRQMSTIVGITDIDNNGLCGIEYSYNNLLRGSPTTCMLEKDARSGLFYFKRKITDSGREGEPIYLTIDSDLQFLVYEELYDTMITLSAQEGAALIMNPENGEILTMVSLPDFDPLHLTTTSLEHTKNRVVTDVYELGSVMKVFSAIAALDENVVTLDELIDCKNTKTAYIDGRKINTVTPHGTIAFADVVALSNNIGMAIVTKRLGAKLYDHYVRIGFGKKTDIDFAGEQKGFINPPHSWSKQSLISLSYGYEISLSLLQLGCAFCMIANGGYAIKPHLIMPDDSHYSTKKERIYSAETIASIHHILELAVEHGTAQKSKINGYHILSKTGTANMLINNEYSTTRNMFTCAGIIQKDSYNRVVIVFIKDIKEKNRYAATITAPLLQRVAEKMIIHEKIL